MAADGKNVKNGGRPRLVNRGAAGLLNKLAQPADGAPAEPADEVVPLHLVKPLHRKGRTVHGVTPALHDRLVKVSDLTFDSANARLHPDKNKAAVRASLQRYGQLKPVVVRRDTMVVVAGNGTLEAAVALGWTHVAATVVDMTDAEAVGYGVADNRTAELATWDLAALRVAERFLAEQGETDMVGWTAGEMMAMRSEADGFVEPPSQFPEVDENVEVEHVCPKCGYAFSGGEKRQASSAGGHDEDDDS